jgi:hypothetical protein
VARMRSTRAAAAPKPPALHKEDWLNQFEAALLVDLRPDIGRKFTRVVALNEWIEHRDMDPREAARQWASTPPGA